MILDLLPSRADSAAGNMAVDFLLLQRYPADTRARFRHYGWHRPSVTFGFSQKIAEVRERLGEAAALDLCRRPTGGGIVDHRDDWTYALVIPRGHALHDGRAIESYRTVHAALVQTLREFGAAAELEERCDRTTSVPCPPAGTCFQRAAMFDVVEPNSRRKIAGAAQKRNKRGLLVQGSIQRPAAGPLDWDELPERFAVHLGRAMQAEPSATAWPELADEEVEALTEQYASPEWLEYR